MTLSFKLLITGDCGFNNYPLLKLITQKLLVKINVVNEIIIVSDLREGAGMLGEKYAAEMGYEVAEFPYYDISSMRKMFNYADTCLCFWNGEKNQTRYFINVANVFNVETIIVNYSESRWHK